MEGLLNQILQEIHELKSEMATKEELQAMRSEMATKHDIHEIHSELHVIKDTLHRLEQAQPQDIYAMLTTISNKLDDQDAEIIVLNKRLFKVESALERLHNQ